MNWGIILTFIGIFALIKILQHKGILPSWGTSSQAGACPIKKKSQENSDQTIDPNFIKENTVKEETNKE